MREKEVENVLVVFESHPPFKEKLIREEKLAYVECKGKVYVFIAWEGDPENYEEAIDDWNSSRGKEIIEQIRNKWPGAGIELWGNFHCTEDKDKYPNEYGAARWMRAYLGRNEDPFYYQLKRDIGEGTQK